MDIEQELSDLDELIKHARTRKSDLKKQQRLLERSMTDLTPKQHQKVSADMSWHGMEMEKGRLTLHAIAVDCGIADLRASLYYSEMDFHPSGFHHYKYQPRKPRCLREEVK